MHKQSLWDKIWKDKKGHVVIWQWPNVWLWGWLVCTGLSLFVSQSVSNWLWYPGLVFLAIWSGLEMYSGVNYFRRFCGAVVAVLIILQLLNIGR